MCGAIKKVLEKYGVSKLGLSEYVIVKGMYDGIGIAPRNLTQGRICPGCGEGIYSVGSGVTIVSIFEADVGDLVCYGCRCGSVFGKWEGRGKVKI